MKDSDNTGLKGSTLPHKLNPYFFSSLPELTSGIRVTYGSKFLQMDCHSARTEWPESNSCDSWQLCTRPGNNILEISTVVSDTKNVCGVQWLPVCSGKTGKLKLILCENVCLIHNKTRLSLCMCTYNYFTNSKPTYSRKIRINTNKIRIKEPWKRWDFERLDMVM